MDELDARVDAILATTVTDRCEGAFDSEGVLVPNLSWFYVEPERDVPIDQVGVSGGRVWLEWFYGGERQVEVVVTILPGARVQFQLPDLPTDLLALAETQPVADTLKRRLDSGIRFGAAQFLSSRCCCMCSCGCKGVGTVMTDDGVRCIACSHSVEDEGEWVGCGKSTKGWTECPECMTKLTPRLNCFGAVRECKCRLWAMEDGICVKTVPMPEESQ